MAYWETYGVEEKPQHYLIGMLDASLALLGLFMVAIGLYVGAEKEYIFGMLLAALMMGVLAILRFMAHAEQLKDSDPFGDDDGGP